MQHDPKAQSRRKPSESHLFNRAASDYCIQFSPNFTIEDEQPSVNPPTQSRSGHPIEYAAATPESILGANAPLPQSYMQGQIRVSIASRKRKPSTSKRISNAEKQKKQKKEATRCAPPSANLDAYVDIAAEAIDEENTEPAQQTAPPSPHKSPIVKATLSPLQSGDTEIVDYPTPTNTDLPSIDDVEDTVIPDPDEAKETAKDDPFDFNIYKFISDDKEEVLSKPTTEPTVELRTTLLDIADRLNIKIESLVFDSGSIRSRVLEIVNQLPDDLADSLNSVAYLEQYNTRVTRARQRINDQELFNQREKAFASALNTAKDEKISWIKHRRLFLPFPTD
uniref:DUF1409 domain-containing protein n=1 Tax=Leersia perrieri TaxID=77586 RepID=A0A0D9XBP6_9ORYZ